MSKPLYIWRIFLAALAASLVAVILMTFLTIFEISILPPIEDGQHFELAKRIAAALAALPFALVIGLPIALPISMLAGFFMLHVFGDAPCPWEKARWALAGAFAALPVAFIMNRNGAMASTLILAMFMALAGSLSAIMFGTVWLQLSA